MADIFQEIIEKLAQEGIHSPRLEARMILGYVLQCPADSICSGIELDEQQINEVRNIINCRLKHQPLDKIIGRREFYKSEFITNTNVLSPRPDTEILVEEAIKHLNDNPQAHILDLGTGSGCIILSLLKEFPKTLGTAVDISPEALKTAKSNAEKLDLMKRICFINADWFKDDFLQNFKQKFDVIVTNPPYIASAEIDELDEEVKGYDPKIALDGGNDGFDSYIKIAQLAPSLLKQGRMIFIEAGINQARRIAEIFENNGLILQKIVRDLGGVERCVILQNGLQK